MCDEYDASACVLDKVEVDVNRPEHLFVRQAGLP